MKTVVVLTNDPTLAALAEAELSAEHVSVRIFGEGDTIPTTGEALLWDADSCPRLPDTPLPVVGLSRWEQSLPEEIRSHLAALLHRPFPISSLHGIISPLLTPREPPQNPVVPSPTPTASHEEHPHVAFDREHRMIRYGSTEISLTEAEAILFEALFRSAGSTVSGEELHALLGTSGDSNLLNVHICAIRRKLAPIGKDTLLHTVRGKGFSWLRGI